MSCNADLEYEMKHDAIVVAYLADKDTAVEFYSALCNMQWRKKDGIPEDERIIEKLKGVETDLWSCTWRRASAIIADIRNVNYNVDEDYMSFYCAGNEGIVSDRVEECFDRMGWTPAPWNN